MGGCCTICSKLDAKGSGNTPGPDFVSFLGLFRLGLEARRWKPLCVYELMASTVPINLLRIQAAQGVGFSQVRIVQNGLNFKWDKSLCFVAQVSACG
jgi:hypothetical protein